MFVNILDVFECHTSDRKVLFTNTHTNTYQEEYKNGYLNYVFKILLFFTIFI